MHCTKGYLDGAYCCVRVLCMEQSVEHCWRNQGCCQVAGWLCRGASGLAQSTTRSTALHLAAYEGQPDLVELFLAAGLTNGAVDQLGSTPANVAAWRGEAL